MNYSYNLRQELKWSWVLFLPYDSNPFSFICYHSKLGKKIDLIKGESEKVTFVSIKEAEEVSHWTEGKKSDQRWIQGQDSLDPFPFSPVLVKVILPTVTNKAPNVSGLPVVRICFLFHSYLMHKPLLSGGGWLRLMKALTSNRSCKVALGIYVRKPYGRRKWLAF